MPIVEWNANQILNAADRAFEEANMLMGRLFTEEITSNKWPWPDAPSPRDIVDRGILRTSQDWVKLSPSAFEWSWNVDYSLAVHNGATFRDGREFPARPWTEAPLDELPGIFTDEFQKALSRIV